MNACEMQGCGRPTDRRPVRIVFDDGLGSPVVLCFTCASILQGYHFELIQSNGKAGAGVGGPAPRQKGAAHGR